MDTVPSFSSGIDCFAIALYGGKKNGAFRLVRGIPLIGHYENVTMVMTMVIRGERHEDHQGIGVQGKVPEDYG